MSAGMLPAQALRIGVLDFYGLHKISQAQIRKELGAREGDAVPPSKGDAEDHLDRIPGVVESHLEVVCCDGNQMILYVGIEERGAPHFELRRAPSGDVHLPEEIAAVYRQFLDAYRAAGRQGVGDEDLTHGHALSADPSARAVQEMFPNLADQHLAELRAVLRNGGDEFERAAAAYVIGYATKKSGIVDDLQFALKDPDAGVRESAGRNLMALSVLQRLQPDSGIKVVPTWFIEMLNSLSWSDRDRALRALDVLTESRDASALDQLRVRALDSLVEMARWKVLNHALPACILLGRIAGLTEQQIQDDWSRGDRQTIIAAALKTKKK
ncbi:MAG: hypothetical protein ACRD5L_05870 [Bryobacteraceae bacterium]